MQRFIEQQNIARLERLLASEAISEKSRHLIEEQLHAARRRLETLTAVKAGIKPRPRITRAFPRAMPAITGQFQKQFEAAPMPLLLLDPGPGLRIVDANHVYGEATMVRPGRIAGEKLFDPTIPVTPLPMVWPISLTLSALSPRPASRTRWRCSAMTCARRKGRSWSAIGNR
jgi:hypothetical protein